MKYEVTLGRSETIIRSVEAEGYQEAITKAYAGVADHSFTVADVEDEDGEGFEVIGQCESCDTWLMEGHETGDKMRGIEEGGYLCEACCKNAEASFRKGTTLEGP